MRPAECALYFYDIPVENMKQMKTKTLKQPLKLECLHTVLSFHTFLIHINSIPTGFICDGRATVAFKHKSAFFFICRSTVGGLLPEKAATDTELYCLTPWWILTTCATLLIYMDSSSTAAWMLARSLSPAWQIPRKYVPVLPLASLLWLQPPRAWQSCKGAMPVLL